MLTTDDLMLITDWLSEEDSVIHIKRALELAIAEAHYLADLRIEMRLVPEYIYADLRFCDEKEAIDAALGDQSKEKIDKYLDAKYPDRTNKGRARARNTLLEFILHSQNGSIEPEENGEKEDTSDGNVGKDD